MGAKNAEFNYSSFGEQAVHGEDLKNSVSGNGVYQMG